MNNHFFRFKINQIIVLISLCMLCAYGLTYAQSTSTFDNLFLQPSSYWNGSDLSGGFYSGNAYFKNRYDTSYGGSWSGFAYSDMTNDSTSGFSNQYSAITGSGYNNSGNYGLFYYSSYIATSRLKLVSSDTVLGFYVTNSTWAALSMRYGDAFAKKFGGASGNDPDWFKLSILGYYNGFMINDTVVFYLADYRFVNNSLDYIVTSWSWVDLSSMGMLDSLEFLLTSSDTGAYGMNTPAYFCMDNFITKSSFSTTKDIKYFNGNIRAYPNPVVENLNIELTNLPPGHYLIELMNIKGCIVKSFSLDENQRSLINLNDITRGEYILKISNRNIDIRKKIIKL